MAKPKRITYMSLFRKWRLAVGAILGIVIYFWAVFFFPEPILNWISAHVGTGERLIGPLLSILGTSVVAFVALLLIGEPLTTGNSKQAAFYKQQFPSRKIADQYKIDLGQARDYFLAYYDCWQFDSELEHIEYLQTTQDRFWCLFDFLARRLLLLLLVLSCLFLGYETIFEKVEPVALLGKGVFVLVIILLIVLFMGFNRLPSSAKPATGCWKAWSDQNEANYRAYVRALAKQSQEQFFASNQARLRTLIDSSN
jgi:hypothetical protein